MAYQFVVLAASIVALCFTTAAGAAFVTTIFLAYTTDHERPFANTGWRGMVVLIFVAIVAQSTLVTESATRLMEKVANNAVSEVVGSGAKPAPRREAP